MNIELENKQLPVLLITGYLGSGKTTLLNRILTNRRGIKFAVIVNDLGEVNIDADLIEKGGVVGQTDDSLVALQNGCICCTLKMDLIAQLEEIAGIVQDSFAAMELEEDMYISMKASISAAKKGGYVFHYKTPVLIVTANKKGYGNAMADSACALENMMIAANALDLGSCWINQLHWLDENEAVRAFMACFGLTEEETITGGLILGYPEGELNRTMIERRGNPVDWA